MPVISKKAWARTFDSYSCVGMSSDSTLISMPLNGSAALMNHSISFICSSLESVEGWNSLSTHLLASSTPAKAKPANDTVANSATDASRFFRIDFLPFIIQQLKMAHRISNEPKRMSIENPLLRAGTACRTNTWESVMAVPCACHSRYYIGIQFPPLFRTEL